MSEWETDQESEREYEWESEREYEWKSEREYEWEFQGDLYMHVCISVCVKVHCRGINTLADSRGPKTLPKII